MSSFNVPVFVLETLEKHPNADTLSIAKFLGWQCVTKTGSVSVGDLVIYIPLDAILPEVLQTELGLKDLRHVKTVRLRGELSQGLVMKAREGMKAGDDAAEALGLTKYEPSIPTQMQGRARRDDPRFARYTDIENIKNNQNVLQDGEEVVVTEKIHGTNWRGLCVMTADSVTGVPTEDMLIGSHRMNWIEDEGNLYWKAARASGAFEVLKANPNIQLYGEVYGWVQDLRYGFTAGNSTLRFFDAMDTQGNKYMDYDDFVAFCEKNKLETVPLMYRGPWSKSVLDLKNGKTTLAGADNIREGFVVRPIKERYDHKVGRVILKAISEEYLLRKGGTENH